MSTSTIRSVVAALEEAESGGILTETPILEGFSGEKLIGLLQRLASDCKNERDCYLEVGVYQGLTLLSVAMSMNGGHAYGIDNFSQLDPDGRNQRIVSERIKALNLQNASVVNMDYEDALEDLNNIIGDKKVGLYFVDGPHDYRSQLMCLVLAKPHLAEDAVIIIDDSNYRHVRQATRDFLVANPEVKLLFEAYTSSHPYNMNKDEVTSARAGWWNGVNVLVIDRTDSLGTRYPPTLRDRTLFENDHVIHSSRAATFSPYMARLMASVLSLNILRAGLELYKVILHVFQRPHALRGKYRTMNTFSEELPKAKLNDSLSDE